ncbi:MAG: hypothetical protein WBP64_16730, partial [Nitrososphaeraceae archaeon]
VSPSEGVCTNVIVPLTVTHGLITLNLEGDLSAIFCNSKESQSAKFLAAAGAGLGLSVIAAGIGVSAELEECVFEWACSCIILKGKSNNSKRLDDITLVVFLFDMEW